SGPLCTRFTWKDSKGGIITCNVSVGVCACVCGFVLVGVCVWVSVRVCVCRWWCVWLCVSVCVCFHPDAYNIIFNITQTFFLWFYNYGILSLVYFIILFSFWKCTDE